MSLAIQSGLVAHYTNSAYSVAPIEYWNGKMVSHIQNSFSEYGNFFVNLFRSLIPMAMAMPVMEDFPATFNLSDLNGANGFALNGVAHKSEAGTSVQGAGDINGDGFDDLLIGSTIGQAYVVFGEKQHWTGLFELTNLNGANGFVLESGAKDDCFGYTLSGLGDINGDRIDDFVISAPCAPVFQGMKVYVVFGKQGSWPAIFKTSTLNGKNGFIVNGGIEDVGIMPGFLGDFNADGLNDIVLGSPSAGPAGTTYVIFGSRLPWKSPFDLSTLTGQNGFELIGESEYDDSGTSATGAGDVNGDGISDLILGAPGSGKGIGKVYIVFGTDNNWTTPFNLTDLNGKNGAILNGEKPGDNCGTSVDGAFDLNNDGINDVIIGAPNAETKKSMFSCGKSYILFGSRGVWGSRINLENLNGLNGVIVTGQSMGDTSGSSVAGIGDVNQDGIDDVIIGAPGASVSNIASQEGKSYVIYGKNQWSSPLSLGAIDGNNGFILEGEHFNDGSGTSVARIGNFSGAGTNDFVIGAPQQYASSIGKAYVIFGE